MRRFKIFYKIFSLVLVLFICWFILDMYFKVKQGDLIKYNNYWYAQEELKSMLP